MSKPLMLVAALLLTMFSAPGFSASHEHGSQNIKMESAHDAATTLDRLEAIFKEKGITVFARVNHAAGAKKIGADLPPTELLIFGNPKLGTPLMKVNRETGLDLPMKALAWTDDAGKTWLALTNPVVLKERYKLDDASAVIEKMTGAVTAMGKSAAGQ
jgi:uncharacterized protein (DUF302 family)